MLRSSSIRHPPFYLEFSILLCRFNNSRCNLLICRHLVFVYIALPTVVISLTQSHKLASENLFLTYILVDFKFICSYLFCSHERILFSFSFFWNSCTSTFAQWRRLGSYRQPPPSNVLRSDHFEDCNICNFKKTIDGLHFFLFSKTAWKMFLFCFFS